MEALLLLLASVSPAAKPHKPDCRECHADVKQVCLLNDTLQGSNVTAAPSTAS
jgi:hypothetical protein